MITTSKYMIKITQINHVVFLITMYDKNGKVAKAYSSLAREVLDSDKDRNKDAVAFVR